MAIALRSVLAWFFWLQIASLPHSGQIKTGGRELRDFRASWSGNLHLEDARSHQLAGGAFIHGEEAATNPVPAVIMMRVIHADHDFNLGLSPEAGTIGRAQRHAGIKIGVSVFAIGADHFNARLIVRTQAQIIVRLKFKANFFGGGHLIFGTKLDPFAADAYAVTFSLVRTWHHALSAARKCGYAQERENRNECFDRLVRTVDIKDAAEKLRCFQVRLRTEISLAVREKE